MGATTALDACMCAGKVHSLSTLIFRGLCMWVSKVQTVNVLTVIH